MRIFTPENPVFSAKGARGDQHRPHSGGADRGDAGQRHPARLRSPREAWRSSPGSRSDPGHHAAAGARPAGGRGGWRPTTSRSAQLNRQIGGGVSAPVDEGRLGRFADGSRRPRSPACTACRCSTPPSTRWRPTSPWRWCMRRAAKTTGRWSMWRSARPSTCTARPRWRRRRPPATTAMRPTR